MPTPSTLNMQPHNLLTEVSATVSFAWHVQPGHECAACSLPGTSSCLCADSLKGLQSKQSQGILVGRALGMDCV